MKTSLVPAFEVKYKTNNAHMAVPINAEANVDKEQPPVSDPGVAVCEL